MNVLYLGVKKWRETLSRTSSFLSFIYILKTFLFVYNRMWLKATSLASISPGKKLLTPLCFLHRRICMKQPIISHHTPTESRQLLRSDQAHSNLIKQKHLWSPQSNHHVILLCHSSLAITQIHPMSETLFPAFLRWGMLLLLL